MRATGNSMCAGARRPGTVFDLPRFQTEATQGTGWPWPPRAGRPCSSPSRRTASSPPPRSWPGSSPDHRRCSRRPRTRSTANEGLLLVSLSLSTREPDEEHPFGYGKQRFFWTFLVAVLIFLVGGLFSILEGAYRLIAGTGSEGSPLVASSTTATSGRIPVGDGRRPSTRVSRIRIGTLKRAA